MTKRACSFENVALTTGLSWLKACHGRVAQTSALAYQPDWSTHSFQAAINDLEPNSGLRVVVLRYLNEGKLRTLEARGLSGLDLFSNAVIVVPET